jgi:hypothetical protein
LQSNERLQRSEQQSQSQKYGKAVQPQHQHQHQQAISSPIQQLSQLAPLVKDEAQHHHDPSLSKPVSEKPELQNLVLTPMASQQDFPEANTKNVEPGPLDEKSLLGCLLRVVPTEPNAKIRISTTVSVIFSQMFPIYKLHNLCWSMMSSCSCCSSNDMDVKLVHHVVESIDCCNFCIMIAAAKSTW